MKPTILTLVVIRTFEVNRVTNTGKGPKRMIPYEITRGDHKIEISRAPESGTTLTGIIARFVDLKTEEGSIMVPLGYLVALDKKTTPGAEEGTVENLSPFTKKSIAPAIKIIEEARKNKGNRLKKFEHLKKKFVT